MSKQKLILSTCVPDNYQETLWRIGSKINFKEYGIDYWFPRHFSIYDNDSKLLHYINAKRQQIHAVYIKSQFVWFRLGEHINLDFLNPISNASKQSFIEILNIIIIFCMWFKYFKYYFLRIK